MHRSSLFLLKIFGSGFFQAFSGFSAHNVDVDLNGTVDHALGVGLIEQVYQDLALLHRNAGVGGHCVAIHELAVGGSDIQLGAVGVQPATIAAT